MCAVCLRKLAFYLHFEGQELDRYIKLKEVFELMNHNDPDQNFTREIKMFKCIIAKL